MSGISSRSSRTDLRRELRLYAGLASAILGGGLLAAVVAYAWRLGGGLATDQWERLPVEVRVAVQLSVLVVGVATAALAAFRTWRSWQGRRRARRAARDVPPLLEFSAGSVTAATLARGERLGDDLRRLLAEHRRKYVVPPRDAVARARRTWGEPVVFVEPTRAGDTRLAPVLALAATERRKHQRNLQVLLQGAGQLSSLRVVIGVGKGYTSITRAHALRDDLARVPAKFRVSCFITDPPAAAAAAAEPEPAPARVEVVA